MRGEQHVMGGRPAWTIGSIPLGRARSSHCRPVTMGVEAAPAERLPSAPLPWWESRLCLAVVVLATMVPLVYPPVPPLVDLLGHMGRYRVELDLGHSVWLQRYYDYHWAAIGNLGVDLLVIPLAKLVGLEPAVKIIVLLTPPLT